MKTSSVAKYIVCLLSISCSPQPQADVHFVEIRLVDENRDSTSVIMNLQGTSESIALQKEVLLNLSHVKSATVTEDNQQPGYRVNLIFTDEGAERFRSMTRDNIRKRVGVIVGGVLVYAPYIMAEMPGDSAPIYFGLPQEQADIIVGRIKGQIQRLR